MAAEGNSQFEMTAHKRTYEGFISMFKVGTMISAVLALIVILLISN